MPTENIVVEGAQIIFRNFEGKEGRYNKKGDRNLAILLDDETANRMAEDDWNVKWLKPREDDDPEATPQAFLPIALKYDAGRPPLVKVITSQNTEIYGENEVEMLDWAVITNADLVFRPYTWEVNGRGGVKAYLQSLYVTIEEDYLQLKYRALE